MNCTYKIDDIINLLRCAKSAVEKARIDAPATLALCLDLATVAISLQRDINRCERIKASLDKDIEQDITVVTIKTK